MDEVNYYLHFDIITQERCRVVSRKQSFTNMRVEYALDGTTAYVNEQDIAPIVRLWLSAKT